MYSRKETNKNKFKISAQNSFFIFEVSTDRESLEISVIKSDKNNLVMSKYQENFTLESLRKINPIFNIVDSIKGKSEDFFNEITAIIKKEDFSFSPLEDKLIIKFTYPSKTSNEISISLPFVNLTSKEKISILYEKLSEYKKKMERIENKVLEIENKKNYHEEFKNSNESYGNLELSTKVSDIIPSSITNKLNFFAAKPTELLISNFHFAYFVKSSLLRTETFHDIEEKIFYIFQDIQKQQKKLSNEIKILPKYKEKEEYKKIISKQNSSKPYFKEDLQMINKYSNEFDTLKEKLKEQEKNSMKFEELKEFFEKSIVNFAQVMLQKLSEKHKEITSSLKYTFSNIKQINAKIEELLENLNLKDKSKLKKIVSDLNVLLSENIVEKYKENADILHKIKLSINKMLFLEEKIEENEQKMELMKNEIIKLKFDNNSLLNEKESLKQEKLNYGKCRDIVDYSIKGFDFTDCENIKKYISDLNRKIQTINEEPLPKEINKLNVKENNISQKFLLKKNTLKVPKEKETSNDSFLTTQTEVMENEIDLSYFPLSIPPKRISKSKAEKREINLNFLENIKIESVMTNHTDSVYSLCLLKDGRLASCSWDKTINIFNLTDYQCELTIFGHSGNVYYISTLTNGYLISASHDTTIRIWEIINDNYRCVKVLKGHKLDVNKVIELSHDRIASCSDDETIIIWNSTYPFQEIKRLKQHTSYVESLIELKNQDLIVSGGVDWKIIFWDNITYKCAYEINDIICFSRNSLLELEDNLLIIGGYKKVTIINLSNFQIEKEIILEEAGYVCSMIEFQDGTILCGDGGGHFFHLDALSNQIIDVKENVHESSIYGLLLINNNTFASCSNDKSVKIWKSESTSCTIF